MTYEVQTDVFEGPFDLLLHLILREQVELWDVSLVRIVDAYLAELQKMEELDLEIATEFLLIAATLVELKSRRLLPDESDVDLDEEFALWEERDLLLARLLECKTFKDAALQIERLEQVASRSWPRVAGIEDAFLDLTPDVMERVGPLDIRDAFVRATKPRPVESVRLDHVAPIRASLVDAISEVVTEVKRHGSLSFRGLCDGLVERLEVVVRFLAVLELYKQGIVELDQSDIFGEITVFWASDGDDIDAEQLVAVDAYDG